MYEKKAIVNLNQGLHARPATEFIQKVRQFGSKVFVIKEGKAVDAGSILGLMSMAVVKGTEVTIRAEGADEVEAVETLCKFLTQTE
ncbi:HPr-like protein Crh [[Clostridium] ultunense Esp]|uniref:HPr family phosphocarrier protein n=1 Tax=Thermicanus aegyptius TaxID=94009 RepID=UPI0002B7094E|nr:HPr family phosphocarrier protein [Thermicanus aegyptius]CCQ94288.1 HPr-like protein Crh [[Clostridium] ultunense Esp]